MYLLHHEDLTTHTTIEVDLSRSRAECALDLAKAYTQQFEKKLNANTILYFSRSSSLYHAVRNLLENIATDDFTVVLARFKELHPLVSEDWQGALELGLYVVACRRVGNYSTGPYLHNNPLAIALRVAGGISYIKPIINGILNS